MKNDGNIRGNGVDVCLPLEHHKSFGSRGVLVQWLPG